MTSRPCVSSGEPERGCVSREALEWVRSAYEHEGPYTIWSMQVAYLAGRDAATPLKPGDKLYAAHVPSGWQPIETAPRDGTDIILGYERSHAEEGRWMADASRNHWGETGWFATSDDALCDHPSKPTHWQPLPPPPIAAAQGESDE